MTVTEEDIKLAMSMLPPVPKCGPWRPVWLLDDFRHLLKED